MSDPQPPSPPPPDDDEPEYRPRKETPSWAVGCLVSLLVLGLIFFFIISVCTRV